MQNHIDLIDDQVPAGLVGDLGRLRQVLINLIGNAVKFTEEGEVVVSVTSELAPSEGEPLHRVHFAVKDTGIGIPQDRRDRLFKSFSQVDASTTRKYGGTGPGLSISKRLVEMMGGTIWVESDNVPGQGATFHFTIVAPAADGPRYTRLRSVQPQLTGRRLLIVDDNETNRYILVQQARSWGLAARAASSGYEALEWIRRGDPFALAILDMQMPGMDGLTLAAEIRKHRPAEALPLLILSSAGRQLDDSRNGFIGAFLTKPVKSSQLFDALMGIFAGKPTPVVRPRGSRAGFDREMGKTFPLRILLAEDNSVNQQVALRMLERLSYHADVASDGREVLEALGRQPYDVVFMDVQMPEMDGIEATKQIRAGWDPESSPRIIAMTAHAMAGDRERLLAAGMDDYISKPVRLEALVEVLSRSEPLASSAGEGSDHGSLVDWKIVAELQASMGEGGADIIADLIAMYQEQAPYLLTQMQGAVDRGDGEQLSMSAHKLNGSSAALGAIAMRQRCGELEQMGVGGELSSAGEIIQAVQRVYRETVRALRGRYDDSPAAEQVIDKPSSGT